MRIIAGQSVLYISLFVESSHLFYDLPISVEHCSSCTYKRVDSIFYFKFCCLHLITMIIISSHLSYTASYDDDWITLFFIAVTGVCETNREESFY
jgi:hypothetical protein